ncbi:MAG: META domain-containing protein [Spirulina sp.]
MRTFELFLVVLMAGFSGIAPDRAPSAIAVEAPTQSLEETSWQFSGWGDRRFPLTGTAITLKFKGDRVNGSAGCNGYTAIYRRSREIISIRRVATTRMACPSAIMEQEEQFLAALRSARSYTMNDRGQLEIVYQGDAGAGTLIFTAETVMPEPLVDTTWQLISWGNPRVQNSPLNNTTITLQFFPERLTGSAGCNRYNASYETAEGRLTISPIATTKMACPMAISQQESRYLAALQNAIRYELNAKGQLEIFYQGDRGMEVLTFTVEPLSFQAKLGKATLR